MRDVIGSQASQSHGRSPSPVLQVGSPSNNGPDKRAKRSSQEHGEIEGLSDPSSPLLAQLTALSVPSPLHLSPFLGPASSYISFNDIPGVDASITASATSSKNAAAGDSLSSQGGAPVFGLDPSDESDFPASEPMSATLSAGSSYYPSQQHLGDTLLLLPVAASLPSSDVLLQQRPLSLWGQELAPNQKPFFSRAEDEPGSSVQGQRVRNGTNSGALANGYSSDFFFRNHAARVQLRKNVKGFDGVCSGSMQVILRLIKTFKVYFSILLASWHVMFHC